MIIPAGQAFANLFVSAIVVASLYFARDILVPVVLAVLLTFMMTPIVTFLQRWYMPRGVAVVAAVLMTATIILSLGTMVASQVNQLATELPRYQATLHAKVQHLRDTLGAPGVFKNAVDLFNDLDRELDRPDSARAAAKPGETDVAKPLPVEIHQPPPSASERLMALLSPLLSPLTTIGMVLLFATFFLFQREDLRNRIIRLAGARDIERTTTALNDAGQRLQQLFATQLIVNAIFGAVIGSGLALIGVPNAPLWGVLAAILRFVPYAGAILCALLPILLAAAVGQNWSMVLWTILLFAVVEPLTAQVAEPLAYGRRTGLSPVAIVLSAVFWTWLWGPIGLLVSTPLTLCVVVISRHVERMKFIDIMFGDQPPLSPPQMLYQRMLANDPVEAADHVTRALKTMSVFDYCRDILLGALRLAQDDLDRGRLDSERIADISHCVDEIIEDLAELDARDTARDRKKEVAFGTSPSTNVLRFAADKNGQTIVALPGRGKLDRQAALVLAFVLEREGFATAVPEQSSPSLAEFNGAAAICVCHVSPIHESLVRYTLRRVRRTAATQPLIIVSLGNHALPDASAAPEPMVTTLESVIETMHAIEPHDLKPRVRAD